MRGGRRRSALTVALLGAWLLLALPGCGDVTVTTATPSASSTSAITLPPIGFNHRYGNNPVAAADGFHLERHFFSSQQYWEVALVTTPEAAGYIDTKDAKAVAAARHAMTSVSMTLATETRGAIVGLLAWGDDGAQQPYAQQLLSIVRATGYDSVTSFKLLIFFTEQDEHAALTWTQASGFSYSVLDHDLAGSALRPSPGVTPLPTLTPG